MINIYGVYIAYFVMTCKDDKMPVEAECFGYILYTPATVMCNRKSRQHFLLVWL